jgi:hypothetical protein
MQYADHAACSADIDTPHSTAADIHREVRRQFEEHRNAPDAYAIKYLLSDGRVQLKQLREIIGLKQ